MKSNKKPAQFLNRHNNYSIRKFTIGTASILVGTTLIFGLSNEAHVQSNSSAKVSDKVATEQSASTSQEADSSQQTAASNAQNVQTAPEQDKATPTTEVNSNNNQTDSKHVAPQKEQNQTATQTESKKETAQTQAKTEEKAASDSKKASEDSDDKATSKETDENKTDDSVDTNSNITTPVYDTTRARAATSVPLASSLDSDASAAENAEPPAEFIDKYNKSTNRSQLVHDLLAESYSETDVRAIVNRLNIDFNKTDAKKAFQAIMYAGIQYAKEQTSLYTTYATIPGDGVNVNNTEIGSVAELKRSIYIDPNKGLTVNGQGYTSQGQSPANYTVHVQPNKRTNKMDFTVTWKVNPSASASGHDADLGGFNFGSGYNVPERINGRFNIYGGNTISNNLDMIKSPHPSYPAGYGLSSRPTITRYFVQRGGRVEYHFSVPVRDWNGDLSFNGKVLMFDNNVTLVGQGVMNPNSNDNYFYDEMNIQGDNNPDRHIITTDDTSEVENIPFQIEYVVSKDLPVGQQEVQREGQVGKRGTLYSIVKFNNQTIGRFVKETYNIPPVNKIIKIGIGAVNDSNISGPLPPILEPQLSGTNIVSGETSPNAAVTITVGGRNYQTTSDNSGRFNFQLPNYTLQEGDHISAVATVEGKTSKPGKIIIPRDGRTPNLTTSVQRGQDQNKPGSWVTITNATTGQQVSRFFVPDGLPGNDGRSITITNEYLDPSTGERVVQFSDGRTIRLPKGPKGDKGDTGAQGPAGRSITITSTTVDADGNTIVRFSDNTTLKIPKGPKGDKGDQGPAGKSITVKHISKDSQGNTTVQFSDNSSIIIPAGTPGRNGTSVGIRTITPQANGDTVVTFTDGKTMTIPKGAKGDRGEAGPKGADGHSITITSNTVEPNGDRKIVFSDHTTVVIPKGDKGDKGDNGTSIGITQIDTDAAGNKVVHFTDGKTMTVPKGQDGTSIGIKSITPQANGDKLVTFTDNRTMVIPKGDKGDKGDKGADGASPTVTATRTQHDGKDGVEITITPANGGTPIKTFVADGERGERGLQGINGVDGKSIRVSSSRDNQKHETTLTFYYDQDGDQAFDASKDIVVDTAVIKDGRTPTVDIKKILRGVSTFRTATATANPDKGHEVKFYYDNNNNGIFDEGDEEISSGFIADGKNGQNGRNGRQGTELISGITPPTDSDGLNGDTYIDTNTGDTYKKENGKWVPSGNIKGPKGDKGENGQNGRDGKDVLNGKVDPQSSQGKDGDKYINTVTGDVFVKSGDNWTNEGNIKGPKGDKGDNGLNGRDGKDVLNGKVNPQPSQGKDGDKYINTVTGDVFVKSGDNWTNEGNIKGPKGDKGDNGLNGRDGKDVLNGKVNPQPSQGKDGDKYINTVTGDVFVKSGDNWT
ncbi:YSIRK-type signal peptide-containing protein, partial [Staphylococcus lugdunensis]|nr:YSIRK-type signal peptide-containing protein [Staphylococcus lugdunensis]